MITCETDLLQMETFKFSETYEIQELKTFEKAI